MKYNNNYYRNILQKNDGFNPIDKWIPFAQTHNFMDTKSKKLSMCPDCNNTDLNTLGQYVYYSNLFHIKFCCKCGLYFSNRLLDQAVISKHFENTYKDEFYFTQQRKSIFEFIAQLINKYTPKNGKVLDIGGGKGHLANIVKNTRPDITINLTDLSEDSCKYCSKTYNIKSFCCNIPDLLEIDEHYNTISLIDVIYYESDLNKMFETIYKLLIPNQGTVIIRIPNKLSAIKFFQFFRNLFSSNNNKFFQSNVKFFNPEHIYVFSKSYITNKLIKSGFNNIKFIPSPLLLNGRLKNKLLGKFIFKITSIIAALTLGKLILTPSLVIIATNSKKK